MQLIRKTSKMLLNSKSGHLLYTCFKDYFIYMAIFICCSASSVTFFCKQKITLKIHRWELKAQYKISTWNHIPFPW